MQLFKLVAYRVLKKPHLSLSFSLNYTPLHIMLSISKKKEFKEKYKRFFELHIYIALRNVYLASSVRRNL